MKKIILINLIVCITLLSGCKNTGEQQEAIQSYPALTVSQTTVEIMESYSASIHGQRDIEIYPQVAGTISRLCVHEGQKVRKGDLLFIIDQIPYRAALRTATANVHAAEANVETARLDYESKQVLFNENVLSEYELLVAYNALTIACAGLEQAHAQETDARNNLSYTELKSPSDGIVSTLPYREGALVSSSVTQPLTTVSDNSQMFVYFSMTENQLRNLIRRYGSPDETIRQMPSVQLQLNDGSTYTEAGRIETISGIINPRTGTASVRSVFPNPERLLFSGGAGSVVIPHKEDAAIVIPQTATYELQDKIYVYKIVETGNRCQVSAVEISVEKLHDGNNYIVRSGLTPGDLIVSEGVGVLRNGVEIRIKEQSIDQ